MATWEDGPEYAPLERPAGFDVPPLPRLDAPVPSERPRIDGPPERPGFEQREAVEALERIGADTRTGERDPHRAFEVARSAMAPPPPTTTGAPVPSAPPNATPPHVSSDATQPSALAGMLPPGDPAWAPTGLADSAWSAVHGRPHPNWAPPAGPPAGHQPQPVQSHPAQHPPFPAPGTNQWFGPGVPPSAPPRPNRLSLGSFISGIDPFVLIALVVGGIVTPVSPVMFILAMGLCARVKYRQTWVRNTFWLGAATVFTTLILAVAVSAGDFDQWYSILARLSMIVCLGVLGVVSILVALALTNGEPPGSDGWDQPGTR